MALDPRLLGLLACPACHGELEDEILVRLEDFGFLERVEPNTHMVPHGDRSGVIIEPYLTDQWYVDAKTMAQPAIAAVGPVKKLERHHVFAARFARGREAAE